MENCGILRSISFDFVELTIMFHFYEFDVGEGLRALPFFVGADVLDSPK